jgi:uncharacterized protein (DUF2252 family)
MTLSLERTPFARAIEQYLAEIKRDEDSKNPFYREVLTEASAVWHEKFDPEQTRKSAENLKSFVDKLQQKQRTQSRTLSVMRRLQPLVSGLNQYAAAMDVAIQACPSAVVILYAGARLVLQVKRLHATIGVLG